MSVVQGACAPQFQAVKDEFEKNFAERGELGASVCISVKGETVLDLWGGVADKASGKPWGEDTVGCVFSCTKAQTALAAHMLIDRGELDPHALVTDYWPEFGQKGKDKVTVQMMLNHESAVAGYRAPLPAGAFNDWDLMARLTAEEEPWWEPGTRGGYHMISFGWTVGELVRRVSGKSLGTFFREEIAEPCGADKYYIGVPEGGELDIATIETYAPREGEELGEFTLTLLTQPDSLQAKSFLNMGGWWPNDPAFRQAEIGGGGGVGNARMQVKIYEVLANGGHHKGVSLVSPERLKRMGMVTAATSRDATLLVPVRFASGFMKSMDNRGLPGGHLMSAIIGDQAFGHVGAGGSIGFADPECGMAFSYTMNQMGPGLLLNARGQSLVDAAYTALGYTTNAPGAWVR